MKFRNDRLIMIRENLGINKAEAARRLNMSAMGYGRYEKGEREPSFQTVNFIANTFGTTSNYLYGLSDDAVSETISISSLEDPDLFYLTQRLKNNPDMIKRILAYANKLKTTDN